MNQFLSPTQEKPKMENYPSYSYPDSGDSSPRSREIEFENPPPSWEDPSQQQPNTNTSKVKFMVSYGGKIQPRTHDHSLSYIGGETKILSVDRNVKFSTLFSKLSTIFASENNSDAVSAAVLGFTLKYQLPGEDLDALISVTNDDDLENMMHEYDRLYRGSSKPARLRVFLFPVQKSSSFGSTSSDKIDRESDRFVEALNSGPPQNQVNNNVDFLFGLEKSAVQIPVQVPIPGQIPVQRHEPDHQIDARIQELNRMQISKSDDGSMFAGAPANMPVGYWQQQQQQPPPPPQHQPLNIEQLQQPPPQQPPQLQQFQQQFQQHHQNQQLQQPPPPPQHQLQHQHQHQHQHQQQQQPVYMVHAPPQGNVYHAPMMRPVTGQPSQGGGGYYQVQRVGSEQVYGVGPGKMGGYSEGMGLPVRPVVSMGGVENNVGYQQVAYDSGTGRQMYYAAPQTGVVTAPPQGVAVSGSGELRTVASATVADAKVVQK